MTELTAYLSSLISLMFLAVLAFWMYPSYRVDSYRQKLFILRDTLFDEAEKGSIPFDSEAYRMVRDTMNGTIQFAHRIGLLQFIMFLLLTKKNKEKTEGMLFAEKLESSLKELSNEQSDIIRHYRLKMNLLFIEHLVLSSPLVLFSVLIPITLLSKLKESLLKLVKTRVDELDSAALVVGGPAKLKC